MNMPTKFEVRRGIQKIGQSLDMSTPRSLLSKNLMGFCSDGTCEYTGPNLKSVVLPVPEIIAIEVLGGVANPQS